LELADVQKDQKRRFDPLPLTSGLALLTDIVGSVGMSQTRYPRNVSLESITAFSTVSVTEVFNSKSGEVDMAKREQRSNREAKKPKKEKIKVIAAAPSQKGAGWQPALGSGKKK
jgi:hypothetical protein